MPVPLWSSRWCRLIASQRLLFLMVLVGVLGLGLWCSRHVSLSAKMTDYYPAQHPHVRLYHEFTEMLKMTNTVVITVSVKHGTVYTNETLGKIHRLTVALLETKGVNPFEVLSLTNPRLKDIRIREESINILPVVNNPDQPQTPDALTRIKNAVYTNVGIRGVYVSPDDKTALIRAGFWDGMVEPRTVLTRLQEIAARERDANTDIQFTGNLVLAAWLMDSAQRVLLLLVVGSVLSLLFSWWFLGIGSGIVLTLFVTFLSASSGLGLLGAWQLTLEPLTLFILFPLGIRGIGLVICWRAQLAQAAQIELPPFAEHEYREQLLDHTATATLQPLTVGLCVDALAFFSLVFTDVPVVQSVGILGAGWVMGLLVALWVLLPLWSATFSSYSLPILRQSRGEELVARLTRHNTTVAAPQRIFPLFVCALVVLGIVSAFQLRAGQEMLGTSLFYQSHPYNRAFNIVNGQFIGINQLIVIAQANGAGALRNPRTLQAIEAFQYHMANDREFGGTIAITNLIKTLTRMFHEDIPKWEVIPDDMESTGQVMFRVISSAATPTEVARFFSNDFRTTAVTFFYHQYSPTIVTRIMQRAQALIATANKSEIQFRVGGGLFGLLSAINASVERDYWRFVGLFFFLAALGAWSSSGSLRITFGVVLSLLLVEAASLFLLWQGGIDLNMYTLPIILVGMGMFLLPIFLLWTNQALALFLQPLVRAGLIAGSGAAVWLVSPLRFQAEMGVFLIAIAVFSTILPVYTYRLFQQWQAEAAGTEKR